MSEPEKRSDADERERRNAEYKRDHSTAFPRRDESQLATIEEFAECRTFRDGEHLRRAGDTEFKVPRDQDGARRNSRPLRDPSDSTGLACITQPLRWRRGTLKLHGHAMLDALDLAEVDRIPFREEWYRESVQTFHELEAL